MKSLVCGMAAICLVVLGTVFTSCDKYEEEGMNEGLMYYNYRAITQDFNYSDAAGPFDTAIRFAGCFDPVLGGDDEKIIRVCDALYEELKKDLKGKSGSVAIIKIRHPDGKQKILRTYKF